MALDIPVNRKQEKKILLQASALVALSALLYGLLGFFGTRVLHEGLNMESMQFWRFFLAALWMLPFTLKGKPPGRANFTFLFWLSILGYAGSSQFYFLATQQIGTGLAMVIFFSYPILVALLLWVCHRKWPKLTTCLALVCC
jgi:drug/metabolite transporter (DMT)-like permease